MNIKSLSSLGVILSPLYRITPCLIIAKCFVIQQALIVPFGIEPKSPVPKTGMIATTLWN